jgi:hypothetical protein
LVAVQSFGSENSVVIDHRLAGVAAAAVALRFGANFPAMMLLAAVVSAVMYRL